MSASISPEAARATRRSFGTAERLREQVLAIGGSKGRVMTHSERAWASATFSGARHTLVLAFEGRDEFLAAGTILMQIDEHEFSIPGQLVVAACCADIETVAGPPHRLLMTLDLLVLEDS